MPLLETEIGQVIQGVWTDFLEMPVERSPRLSPQPVESRALTGCVRFTGVWRGMLLLQCPFELARRAASVMFHLEPDQVGVEDARDAIGELANMVGGNLKVLLPSPCRMGLPAVAEGSAAPQSVAGGQLLHQLLFQCQGQPFVVTLLEFEEAFSRAHPGEGGRREFCRASAEFKVVLTAEDRALICGAQLQDVSMNGLSCRCPDPFPVGTPCRVTLLLGDPENFLRVEARGRVVRATDAGMAVEFAEIDRDSYHHLCNLVLHNSADPDRAETEIKNHLGLKSR